MVESVSESGQGPQELLSEQSKETKKNKRFLCKRCQTRFARLEHLQRHERIRKFFNSLFLRRLVFPFFEKHPAPGQV